MTLSCDMDPKCGSADLHKAAKSQPKSETAVYLARLYAARDKAAVLISDGEEWVLPHFERILAEIEKLEEKQKRLDLALEIARKAKQPRAD
nr:hypothetical protein [uncultured Cohaesibacter sp.]